MKKKKHDVIEYMKYALIAGSVITVLILLCLNFGHIHDYGEWITEREPSCSALGLKRRYCSCGEHQSFFSEKLPHTEGEWISDAEAGKRMLLCAVCGAVMQTESIPIEPHRHAWSEWTVSIEPTCSQSGLRTRVCECGQSDVGVIDRVDHSYGSWSTVRSADCTENGMRERKCDFCGKTETEAIPSLGHNSDGEYEEGGFLYHYCTRCNKIIDKTVISSLPDSPGTPASTDSQSSPLIIENGVVTGCTDNSLTKISIPSQYGGIPVTAIGREAFAENTALISVTLPDSITTIEYRAFYNCTSLRAINLQGVAHIEQSSFQNCTSLSSITLGKCVKDIGWYAFGCCTSLKNIYYKGSAEDWETVDLDGNWCSYAGCSVPTFKE